SAQDEGIDRALREEHRLRGRPPRLHGEAQAALSRRLMKTPLRIRALQARAVAAPMKRPLATSTGKLTEAALLLIDLRTDQDIVGRSYLFGIGKHNLPPIAKLVEAMGEMIKGDALAPFD